MTSLSAQLESLNPLIYPRKKKLPGYTGPRAGLAYPALVALFWMNPPGRIPYFKTPLKSTIDDLTLELLMGYTPLWFLINQLQENLSHNVCEMDQVNMPYKILDQPIYMQPVSKTTPWDYCEIPEVLPHAENLWSHKLTGDRKGSRGTEARGIGSINLGIFCILTTSSVRVISLTMLNYTFLVCPDILKGVSFCILKKIGFISVIPDQTNIHPSQSTWWYQTRLQRLWGVMYLSGRISSIIDQGLSSGSEW